MVEFNKLKETAGSLALGGPLRLTVGTMFTAG